MFPILADTAIETAIEELHKGFHLLNERLFDATLPVPAILCQYQGNRTRNILGWCTTDKVWSSNDKQIQMYEINITAEYLSRPIVAIMETMIHEMVHLYCIMNKIKDTSRSGTYHNKRYKEQAERFGLSVEFDKQRGWATTALIPETEELINSLPLNPNAFLIKRLTWGEEVEEDGEKKPRDGSVKRFWRCPTEDCENYKIEIKALKKKTLDVICGKCREHFVLVEEEPETDEDN